MSITDTVDAVRLPGDDPAEDSSMRHLEYVVALVALAAVVLLAFLR